MLAKSETSTSDHYPKKEKDMQIAPDKKIELAIDLVKALGLLISGLWAAWTFQRLQRVRAAKLEIDEKSSRIRTSRLEQQASRTKLSAQQPQLSVNLMITEDRSPSSEYKSLLCVTVAMTNHGEQNLEALFEPSALTIATISFRTDETSSMKVVLRTCPIYISADTDDPQVMRTRVFRSGQTRKMGIAVLPVTELSTYFIQFQVIYHKIPFDGENPPRANPVYINAIEQAFYTTSGNPTLAREEV
jgi:hypothetical protein